MLDAYWIQYRFGLVRAPYTKMLLFPMFHKAMCFFWERKKGNRMLFEKNTRSQQKNIETRAAVFCVVFQHWTSERNWIACQIHALRLQRYRSEGVVSNTRCLFFVHVKKHRCVKNGNKEIQASFWLDVRCSLFFRLFEGTCFENGVFYILLIGFFINGLIKKTNFHSSPCLRYLDAMYGCGNCMENCWLFLFGLSYVMDTEPFLC